jgi:hypothetical protein
MLLSNIPNPNYMNGTIATQKGMRGIMRLTPSMNGIMMLDQGAAAEISRFGLAEDDRGVPTGDGMGTTGSLGVSYAAPLTRGGFPGEIFDSAPMPTGNWRQAPTPTMLGSNGMGSNEAGIATAGVAIMVVGLAFSCALYYGAFKYYFTDDCKCKK